MHSPYCIFDFGLLFPSTGVSVVELSRGEDSEHTRFEAAGWSPNHLLHVYYGRCSGLCVLREPVLHPFKLRSEFAKLSLRGQPALEVSEIASLNRAALCRDRLGSLVLPTRPCLRQHIIQCLTHIYNVCTDWLFLFCDICFLSHSLPLAAFLLAISVSSCHQLVRDW